MRLDEFDLSNKDECDRCLGLGHHPSGNGEDCPECHGTGKCPKSDEPVDESADRVKTLYLMVDHNFERKNVAKVARKSGLEVFDNGSGLKPMSFGVDPLSYTAERFKDELKTWGYEFRDVTDIWKNRAEVLKSIDKGDTDSVANQFVQGQRVSEEGKEESYEGESKCDNCGGEMDWCSSCDRWTSTCCVEYGTCMCS